MSGLNYTYVGEWVRSNPLTITTSDGDSSSTIYIRFCDKCGKRERLPHEAGCWPPVDYCQCEISAPETVDWRFRLYPEDNRQPWTCPGCGMHYAPHVDSCECDQ